MCACVQEVLIDILGFNDRPDRVLAHVNASVQDGRTCLQVGGRTVCLFTCMRYNYCHVDQSCCTDPARLPLALTSFDDLSAARVKVGALPCPYLPSQRTESCLHMLGRLGTNMPLCS